MVMIDQTTTNIHRTVPSNLENTVAGLLGQAVMLNARIRTLQHDQERLLSALGLDPDREGIEDGIAVAQALVSLLEE